MLPIGRSDRGVVFNELTRLPRLLDFFHEITEGLDAHVEEIEEKYDAFLQALRVSVHILRPQSATNLVTFRRYLMRRFQHHIHN
jgi:hypothetical protein